MDNISKQFGDKLITKILEMPEFKDELKLAAEEITEEVKKANTEATIEGVFERVLYAKLQLIGIRFHPEKEVSVGTRRHTGKGRMDSRIGAVVIEYKHTSNLKSQSNISSAMNQLEEYISSYSKELSNEIVGFLTDGLSLYEIRSSNGDIISRSGKLKIDDKSLLNLIRCVVSLEHSALTSDNLIRDFCGKSYQGVLFGVAKILNSILIKNSTLKTDMLRSEWEELFRLGLAEK